MKIVAINSYGPMGSALLGGLVEKLGAVNLPLRRYELSEYLLQVHSLDSGIMQERIQRKLESNSRPIRAGGINPLDRDGQEARALTDIDKVRRELEALKSGGFSRLQELVWSCRNVYANAVVYKQVVGDDRIHIDYPTDFGTYRAKSGTLYEAYCGQFDDVRMIHLHRDFAKWINAVALQFFVRPNPLDGVKFRLKSWIKNYDNYENAVRNLPGEHICTDDLFASEIESLAERLRSFADLPGTNRDLRQERYDLYGKFAHYDQAFSPVDDKNEFLSRRSRNYFAKCAARPDRVGIVQSAVARALFVASYLAFHQRARNAAKTAT